MNRPLLSIVIASTALVGCGHTLSSNVGLMSIGDIEGRSFPEQIDGRVVEGEDCSKGGWDTFFLSEAVRDALGGTGSDTLVDAEITHTTGLLTFSNCVKVKGTAIDSTSLPLAEADR